MTNIDWETIRAEALDNFTLATLPPTLKLPALPHAVTRFMESANDPETPIGDLAKIIETDTGLTLELLRHVNSSYIGVRHRATSVQKAITLLGIRTCRTFIMTTGMQAAVRSKKSRLINQACFWNASLQKALFAKEVAILLKADAELAFSGALLQDYLLPVLSNDLFEDYLAFVQDRNKFPQSICAFEQEKFGWDHALAAACLAHRWQIPDDLICCILFHHQGLRILVDEKLGRSAAAAVALSALLPDQLRQDFLGLEQLVKLEDKWPAFNLKEIAEKVDEQHAELGMGVANDFPLVRRCRPVFNDETVYQDGTLQATVTSA